MWKIISKTIFWLSIIFIIISIFSLTIGQKTNLEFINLELKNKFYNLIFLGFPIAIILTLFGTIRKKNEIIRNILTSIFTLGLGIFIFIFLVNSMFTIAFGAWVTIDVFYQKKNDDKIQIREQQYDLGALGYGNKKRIVEVKPSAILFYQITEIDTSKIDKTEWKIVSKENKTWEILNDIKFP
ncbi:hypothetical protein QMU91_002515 [Flavobacterium psychrophilum]|nr:hypothetical protein [Flavobacterium psychrophilum]